MSTRQVDTQTLDSAAHLLRAYGHAALAEALLRDEPPSNWPTARLQLGNDGLWLCLSFDGSHANFNLGASPLSNRLATAICTRLFGDHGTRNLHVHAVDDRTTFSSSSVSTLRALVRECRSSVVYDLRNYQRLEDSMDKDATQQTVRDAITAEVTRLTLLVHRIDDLG